MKKGLLKLYAIIGSAFMSAFLMLRFVLELIGYATITDDAKEAHGILRVLADMALALPWWAIWWPLFISYVCACGIALDFSFDIFKRLPKAKPQTEADKLKKLSNKFSREFSGVRSEHHQFMSDEYKISAASEVEIFRERLAGFGIQEPPRKSRLASDILQLKLFVSRYMPYLNSGDYNKAVTVANGPIPNVNRL